MRRLGVRMAVTVALAGVIAVPVFGQAARAPAPALTALAQIQPGAWDLRARDGGIADRSICLGDPRVLLQIRHGNAACSRFVIANEAGMAVIHYTCPGRGHGRTTIRVETPRLAQIDSQGIVDNEPFAFRAEARRTGACAPGGVTRGR